MRFCLMLFCIFSFSASVDAASSAPTAASSATFAAGRLSVVFDQTPIAVALKQIADQARVPIWLDPAVAGTVSMRLDGVPLESALRRLLRRQSSAFFYRDKPGGGYEISRIKVYLPGNRELARYVLLGGGEKDGQEGKEENMKETGAVAGQSPLSGVPNPGATAQAMVAARHSAAAAHRQGQAQERQRQLMMARLRQRMAQPGFEIQSVTLDGIEPRGVIRPPDDLDRARETVLLVRRMSERTPLEKQRDLLAVQQRMDGLRRHQTSAARR